MPQFERSVTYMVGEAARSIRDVARQNIAPHSDSVPPNIFASRANRIATGEIRAVVRLGRKGYKGYFMERGTGARYTKSGAYRGHMPATPFMQPAKERVIAIVLRGGLNVARYL